MRDAKLDSHRPTLIRMKSVIAWPAPKLRNTAKSHGSALGEAEIESTKVLLGLDPQEKFAMPEDVLSHIRLVKERGAALRRDWDARFDLWKKSNPEKAQLLTRLVQRDLPQGWEEVLPQFESGKDVSTRAASGKVINAIAAVLPEFWGGSSDLAESNNTTIDGGKSFLPSSSAMSEVSPYGRVIHFGIREHAMGSILNGITLHGLSRTFGGTFAVFSDYMRPSVRLASLMKIPTTFVWTHDSIGLGEDGPTHQPIEHLASLRAIPGFAVVRPADANEVAQAWRSILLRNEPVGILLSRQNLPVFERTAANSAQLVEKGAYTLMAAPKDPEVVLIATGSEVSVAVASAVILNEKGISTSVVSAPCLEWFAGESQSYQESVIPKSALRVSIEAGVSVGWREYVGDSGVIISLDHYGASASAGELFAEFGFTAENVVAKVLEARA
jgi:transketolase